MPARAVWRAVEAGVIRASLAATTPTNIDYVLRKRIGKPATRRLIAELLATFEIAPVDRDILKSAHDRGWPDFEDAVQDAAAVAAGIGTIVTRDPRGFAGSTCRIVDAGTLAAGLAGAP